MTDRNYTDDQRRLRARNLTVLFSLLGFVAAIYVYAMVRMAGA